MKKLASIGPVVLMMFLSFTTKKIMPQTSFPFDVKISGKGKQSILFIPGFACSGEVWNGTRTNYEKDFTCYTLTMAGFAE